MKIIKKTVRVHGQSEPRVAVDLGDGNTWCRSEAVAVRAEFASLNSALAHITRVAASLQRDIRRIEAHAKDRRIELTPLTPQEALDVAYAPWSKPEAQSGGSPSA